MRKMLPLLVVVVWVFFLGYLVANWGKVQRLVRNYIPFKSTVKVEIINSAGGYSVKLRDLQTEKKLTSLFDQLLNNKKRNGDIYITEYRPIDDTRRFTVSQRQVNLSLPIKIIFVDHLPLSLGKTAQIRFLLLVGDNGQLSISVYINDVIGQLGEMGAVKAVAEALQFIVTGNISYTFKAEDWLYYQELMESYKQGELMPLVMEKR